MAPLLLPLALPACTAPAPSPAGTGETVEVGGLVFDRRPRNLLLVVLDTTRRDRIGAFGGGEDTPFLDGWLQGSWTAADVRSCSNWTLSSLYCLFTGRMTYEDGFEPFSGDELVPETPVDGAPLLARRLADAGFSTALYSPNAALNAWLPRIDHGYGVYEAQDDAPASWVVDGALAFLEQVGDAPWFLHAHFLDPHFPYTPPESYLAGWSKLDPIPWDLTDAASLPVLEAAWPDQDAATRELLLEHVEVGYRAELAYLDDELERFFGELEAGGWLRDTLVLLWADHGEQFFERDRFTHDRTMHAEEVDAFAAVRGPGLAPAWWTGPVDNLDLHRTLVDLFGLPDPSGTGEPLGARAAPFPRFAHRYKGAEGDQEVVDLDGGRLLYAFDGSRAFYRVDEDPAERIDRYDPADPEVVALWELMEAQVGAVQAAFPHLVPVDAGP